jgi:hypothetical protein
MSASHMLEDAATDASHFPACRAQRAFQLPFLGGAVTTIGHANIYLFVGSHAVSGVPHKIAKTNN